MTLKQYKQASNVTGIWSFLVWFLRTKEGHMVLIGVFILLIILMFVSPEMVMKIKMAFWNMILNKMK
jgi:hypothetical protein